MRYSVLKASTRRMLNADDAGDYLGYRALLDKMEKAGWIKPYSPTSKMRLYDVNDLDLAIDRLKAGDKLE